MAYLPPPRMISAEQVRAALPFAALVPALCEAFARGATVPLRHHHAIAQPDGSEATLLLMPAWQEQGYLGIKVATIHPGNGRRSEEHTSELQSLMRISYAVFCLKKKKKKQKHKQQLYN